MNCKKYESVVEHAAVEVFKKEFERIYRRIYSAATLSREKGILALEDFLDKERISNGDILEFGLQLAEDGRDNKVIEKYLDSWIEANCSGHCEYYDKILFSVIKTGVLSVQAGDNPRIIEMLLKSAVPMELLPDSIEFSLEDIKQCGCLLGYIAKEFRTEEFCCNAVKSYGNALHYVPEEFRTAELCMEAVKRGGSLEYVPEEFKTAELCAIAVKNWNFTLQYMPEALKTEKLCMATVKRGGRELEYVPEALKTAELCLEAVKQWRWALEYVPEALREEVEKQTKKQGGKND